VYKVTYSIEIIGLGLEFFNVQIYFEQVETIGDAYMVVSGQTLMEYVS